MMIILMYENKKCSTANDKAKAGWTFDFTTYWNVQILVQITWKIIIFANILSLFMLVPGRKKNCETVGSEETPCFCNWWRSVFKMCLQNRLSNLRVDLWYCLCYITSYELTIVQFVFKPPHRRRLQELHNLFTSRYSAHLTFYNFRFFDY